jgi:tetratricopeptide (TPR) repeat protein
MREINVGIRIDPIEGLMFDGIEHVNAVLNCGGRVVAIEPGGAIMRKLREDDQNVSLTLSGCEMKVIVDDSGFDASPQKSEHDRLYQEASQLIKPYMQLVGAQVQSADKPEAKQHLARGIELMRQAVAIIPANWAAWWIVGKAHQALGDSQQACDAFAKAFRLNKAHVDVTREYMYECLNLGNPDKGIPLARYALALQPDDAGLTANLALALLLGGKVDDAAQTIEQALALLPDDEISVNLRRDIAAVQSGRKHQPKCIADLGNPS